MFFFSVQYKSEYQGAWLGAWPISFDLVELFASLEQLLLLLGHLFLRLKLLAEADIHLAVDLRGGEGV